LINAKSPYTANGISVSVTTCGVSWDRNPETILVFANGKNGKLAINTAKNADIFLSVSSLTKTYIERGNKRNETKATTCTESEKFIPKMLNIFATKGIIGPEYEVSGIETLKNGKTKIELL